MTQRYNLIQTIYAQVLSTADLEYILTGKPNKSGYVVFARKKFEKANTKNIKNDAFDGLLYLIPLIKKVAKSLVEKT